MKSWEHFFTAYYWTCVEKLEQKLKVKKKRLTSEATQASHFFAFLKWRNANQVEVLREAMHYHEENVSSAKLTQWIFNIFLKSLLVVVSVLKVSICRSCAAQWKTLKLDELNQGGVSKGWLWACCPYLSMPVKVNWCSVPWISLHNDIQFHLIRWA